MFLLIWGDIDTLNHQRQRLLIVVVRHTTYGRKKLQQCLYEGERGREREREREKQEERTRKEERGGERERERERERESATPPPMRGLSLRDIRATFTERWAQMFFLSPFFLLDLHEMKMECGRPLGMRVVGDKLLVADMLVGLVEIDLKSREKRILVPYGADIGGSPVKCPNDVVLGPDGK